MKKRVTRWIVMIAAVCSMMLCPALTGYAADGTLMLSDPTGSVGAEIPVTVRIDAGGQPIGDANVTLSYDPAMLEFVSGTNAQGGEGTVTLSGSGTGTETELAFSGGLYAGALYGGGTGRGNGGNPGDRVYGVSVFGRDA